MESVHIVIIYSGAGILPKILDYTWYIKNCKCEYGSSLNKGVQKSTFITILTQDYFIAGM